MPPDCCDADRERRSSKPQPRDVKSAKECKVMSTQDVASLAVPCRQTSSAAAAKNCAVAAAAWCRPRLLDSFHCFNIHGGPQTEYTCSVKGCKFAWKSLQPLHMLSGRCDQGLMTDGSQAGCSTRFNTTQHVSSSRTFTGSFKTFSNLLFAYFLTVANS